MIKLDCRRCSTGIFMFDDINGFGNLPKRWTCHICGMQYIVKLDETGSPAVFYRQGSAKWRKMELAGLEAIEPAPEPEPEPEPLPEQESQEVTSEDIGRVEDVLGDLAEEERAPEPEETTTKEEPSGS